MKTVIAEQYGGPEVLTIQNVAIPTPKSNEILIKIKATSVTRASGMMREGKPYFGRLFIGLTTPKVKTPGTDLAGIVTAVGSSVTRFNVGDKVMAETGLNYGAYAEYICLPDDGLIIHQPANVSPEEATGILDGASTALAFLTDQVEIKKGDKVLINGASGGIGTAAIQLAKKFGADVTAVCSGKNKALVKDIGADQVFDYTKNELESSSDLYDVIFDTVGTLSYAKSKRNLKENGVYMTPVLSMSVLLNMMFVSPFSQKKLKFDATGMRKKELQMRDLIEIGNLLATNKLKTVIDKVYALNQIQEAHAYVDTGRKRGNVILINE
ncbi:MAG: NADPH:quinone reductase-like Zn-dependent oxidoreductase [Vicingaceae bacterium]|jgi:NADPH:quinone reductase-like Zn-dependent oxidoreductase